jgi:hypothetical protein
LSADVADAEFLPNMKQKPAISCHSKKSPLKETYWLRSSSQGETEWLQQSPLAGFFWDNTSTYFIGYKTHNKINQLKGDRIGIIPRCRAWFRMVIVYTPDIYKYNTRELVI